MNGLYILINSLLKNKQKFSIRLNNQEDITVADVNKWMVADYGDYMKLKYRTLVKKDGRDYFYNVTEHTIPYNSITTIIRGYYEKE